MDPFDLAGTIRRIRRSADLSQRELAHHLGLSKSTVAAVESGDRGLEAQVLARAASLAGLRLALVDPAGQVVAGMTGAAVRDLSGRRFPAHLDTRYADEGWWHDAHHWTRRQVWYTFDLDRERRDGLRAGAGTPQDHQVPQPGDSPQQRKAQRRAEARERQRAEIARRRASGELRPAPEWVCSCPPECDELDDRSGKPVHSEACACGCDIA